MEIALIILSFVLLTTNIYSGTKIFVKKIDSQQEVLSIQTTVDKDDVELEDSDFTPVPSSRAKVDVKVEAQPDKDETVIQPKTHTDWIYPGANTRSDSGNLLVIDSSDHHQQITDWYKDRIKSTGGNVTSFVTTAVNGEIKNELEGAGGDVHVEVKIEKSAISDLVIIQINFKAE